MEQKIRVYVDELFAGTAPSRKSVELKEEMIQNLTEKYNDLLSEGKTPEAAYNIVIAGIGDISDLLRGLERDAVPQDMYTAARQRTALLTAVAVMLYIMSVIPVIICAALLNAPIIGVLLMFVLIAAATGLLIYNGMTKPKYPRNETIVDDFKQWQKGTQEQKALSRAIHSALWTITVAVYFIISFTTQAWHMSWIIFLIAAAVQAVLNAVLALKK